MRTALLFLLAIVTPCGVMAWLSWRSMNAEAELVERQRIAYYQQSADAAAVEASRWVRDQIAGFTTAVDALLKNEAPDKLAARFDAALRQSWPLAQAGVVLDASGAPIARHPPADHVTEFLATNHWLTSGAPDWYFRSGNEETRRLGAPSVVYDTNASRGLVTASKWDRAELDDQAPENRPADNGLAALEKQTREKDFSAQQDKAMLMDRSAGLAGGGRGPESEKLTESPPASEPPVEMTRPKKPEPRGRSQSVVRESTAQAQLQPPAPPAAAPAEPAALSVEATRLTVQAAVSDEVEEAATKSDDAPAAAAEPPPPSAPPRSAQLDRRLRATATKPAPEPAAPVAGEARKAPLYKLAPAEIAETTTAARFTEKAKDSGRTSADFGFGSAVAPTEGFGAAPQGKTAAPRTVRPRHLAPGDPTAVLPSRVQPDLTSLAILSAEESSGVATHAGAAGHVPLVYYRPPQCAEYIFTAALDNAAVRSALQSLPEISAPDDDSLLAVIDEQARPVAQWKTFTERANEPPSQRSWTTPLVAREIGALLPQWETAVFLRHPDVFAMAAVAAGWRLGIIVSAAALAALAGAFFILRDARRIALEARQKTDFVSSVSHELKTPLTSIRMFSDLLAASPEAPPEKTRRYAEVISSEAARLSRLITNVLNFSRLERGDQKLHLSLLDLRDLVTETVDHYRPQLEKAGFAVEVMVPSHPVTVRADRDALSQVVLNLLSNAEKYGHAPDRPHALTLHLTTTGASAKLSVLDRGPGVPRGHEQRIFRKFHRAHDMLTHGAAGSGLGLTIAQKLAAAHGGRIEYAPREGGGASFTLTLPLSA